MSSQSTQLSSVSNRSPSIERRSANLYAANTYILCSYCKELKPNLHSCTISIPETPIKSSSSLDTTSTIEYNIDDIDNLSFETQNLSPPIPDLLDDQSTQDTVPIIYSSNYSLEAQHGSQSPRDSSLN